MCKSDLKPGTPRRRPSSPGSQGRGPHHRPWPRELRPAFPAWRPAAPPRPGPGCTSQLCSSQLSGSR